MKEPMELFERWSMMTVKPPGPRRAVLVPVPVPPEGIQGLGSKVSSELQMPIRSRRSFISGAGFAMGMPEAPAGPVDFFFAAGLSCAEAARHASPATSITVKRAHLIILIISS